MLKFFGFFVLPFLYLGTAFAAAPGEVVTLDCTTQTPLVQMELQATLLSDSQLSNIKIWGYGHGQVYYNLQLASASGKKLTDTKNYAMSFGASDVQGAPIHGPAMAFNLTQVAEGHGLLLPLDFGKSLDSKEIIKGTWLRFDGHDLDEESNYYPINCSLEHAYVNPQ